MHQPVNPVLTSDLCPAALLHRGDLLVLVGLFDGGLLTDDLLQPLQPDVLGAQVSDAGLAAVQQRQGVDVLQLRVADPLVHHQVQELIGGVVQHLVVLPAKDTTNRVKSKQVQTNRSLYFLHHPIIDFLQAPEVTESGLKRKTTVKNKGRRTASHTVLPAD